jgi:ADP-ribose pyrophosphatase YjhB (NUDIX family)
MHESLILVTDVLGKDFHLLPGGKIKLGERSEEACRRELEEELGVRPDRLELAVVLENIYEDPGPVFHEIYFVYRADPSYAAELFQRKLASFWRWIPSERSDEYQLKPEILTSVLIHNDT